MTSRWKSALARRRGAAVAAVAVIALSSGATGPAGATVPPDTHRARRAVTGDDEPTRSITVTRSRLGAPSCPTSPTSTPVCRRAHRRRRRRWTRWARSSQDLVTTLTALGIAEEDIQTSGLSLFPTFDDDGPDDHRLPGVDQRQRHDPRRRVRRRRGRRAEGLRRRGADARRHLVRLRRSRGGARRRPLGGRRERPHEGRRSTPRRPAPSVGEILRIVEGSVPEVPMFAAGVAADEAAPVAGGHRARHAGPRRRRHRRVRHGVSPAAWRRPGHGVRSVAMVLPSPKRAATSISALARAALRPERPDRLPRAAIAMAAWGPTMAGAVAGATARYPLAPALIDDEGTVELRRPVGGERRRRPRPAGPRRRPAQHGRRARSQPSRLRHGVVAAAKLGADIVYLNTGFAGPQLADVVAHEGIDAVLHDDEFAGIAEGCGAPIAVGGAELRALAVERSYLPLLPTRHAGRQVILTSGTTGRPKGAAGRRSARRRCADAAAVDDPDPRPRHRRHRRSAVPRLGSRPPRRRPRPVVDGRAAAAVRSRGDAGGGRRARRRRARRRTR